MKDDPLYDMESGMERMGPPVQVRSHQTNSTIGGVGVTKALNNAVWEKAEIENDRARKGAN